MTNDEKNRKIAEWLGFTQWSRHTGQKPVPDFYTDEEASALVLEKMPRGTISRQDNGQWECSVNAFLHGPYIRNQEDRKTAICEAALKLIKEDNTQ